MVRYTINGHKGGYELRPTEVKITPATNPEFRVTIKIKVNSTR